MYNVGMNGRREQDPPLKQALTPREIEILAVISQGKTNRQVAEELSVSLNTVKWYARQIYGKLGVDGREAAADRARSMGLLPEEDQAEEVRHNLVESATPFVGREQELAALTRLIAEPGVRLITITGPGGMGKTRLALQAAGREVGPQTDFTDGIFFVSLAPLEAAGDSASHHIVRDDSARDHIARDMIAGAIAATLGFHFHDSGRGGQSEQLLDYLAQKRMLLVMDNIEHILDGRSLLAEINRQAGGIMVLVTSRERLQLRGEQVFPLRGLETPRTARATAKAPVDYAAGQLFMSTARRSDPDFQLLDGDEERLLRICRMVDGMPLALELAASWAGLLPIAEIAAEIEQSMDLLTTAYHDVPRRHRSMQATLDVSWARLNTDQQRACEELSVFRGGFTRAAAFGVTGTTLPLLVTLANKSWLTYDRRADRYHFHELLRQYSAARLSANPGHEEKIRRRHSAYFCHFLQERETDWLGARQQKTAVEIRTEVDNIQRAWRWAAAAGDAALLADGLISLCRFYFWEGRLNEGRQACLAAADGLAARQMESSQQIALLALVLARETVFIDDVAQKEALLAEGQALLDGAAERGLDTRRQRAFLLLAKAYAAENRDFDEAIGYANQAQPLFQEIGDRWGEAEAFAMQGADSIFQGAYDRAREFLSASLEIREQLGDKQGIAEATVYLGIVARHQGHFDEAIALDRQCLALYEELGNKFRQAWCLSIHSYTLSWAGEFVPAKEAAGQAAALDRDLGQAPNPWSLNPLAKALSHLGFYDEAQAAASESLAIARRIGHKDQASWALLLLGEIALVRGDLAEAMSYLTESAAILAEMQHTYEALPRAILSHVYLGLGDAQSARGSLAGALRTAHSCHSISPTICCLPAAALLAADNRNDQRAVELYGLAQQFAYVNHSRWFADVACKALDAVRDSLPAEVAATAEARGRVMDVWETAETLLRELDGS